MGRIDVFERYGEVDQEQIEVLDAPKAELMLRQSFRLLHVQTTIDELVEEHTWSY